jgi:predicted GTPase
VTNEKVQIELIDTPGLDEIAGEARANMAKEVAGQADLILFIVAGDITRTEYDALCGLKQSHKPLILVFNKIDLLSDEPRLPKILSRAYPRSISISSQKEEDIKRCRDMIVEFFNIHTKPSVHDIQIGPKEIARIFNRESAEDFDDFPVQKINLKLHLKFFKRKNDSEKSFKVGITGLDDYGAATDSFTGNTGNQFWTGITPPNGGYTIYVAKPFQGPSIHIANDNNQCIFFLKSFGSTGSTIYTFPSLPSSFDIKIFL